MQPALFDTSIYIAALRGSNQSVVALRRVAADAPLWLSSVVLEELYAGAGERERRTVERLERDFEVIRRMLVPNLSDWSQTGRVLARLGNKYGYEEIGQARLTNDALIAISAARLGITVLTANERDFRRLAEFRRLQWQVIAV